MNRLIINVILLFALTSLMSCTNAKTKLLEDQVVLLKGQLDHQQSTNSNLLDRMADLSVINQTDAESIKNSLEVLNRQNEYIQDLSTKIAAKDSINLALMTNLKRSLMDINDTDIQIEVRGSAVFVSISDNLLFSTGSTRVSQGARQVLGKVADIIKDHEHLDVVVKGHTDIVPIKNERIKDNWELSVLRATSVVQVLQNDYFVRPERLTAAGKSMYEPKVEGEDAIALRQNRRTEIILTPGLAQFFALLESPALLD